MPNSCPLRFIAVTTDPSVMVRAASMIDLHAAIAMFRKNWSVRERKSLTSAICSAGRSVRHSSGAMSFANRADAAMLRWCISSPMLIARAITGDRAYPPSVCFRAAASDGPRTSRIHRSRSITSASLAPNRSTLPMPSFIVE